MHPVSVAEDINIEEMMSGGSTGSGPGNGAPHRWGTQVSTPRVASEVSSLHTQPHLGDKLLSSATSLMGGHGGARFAVGDTHIETQEMIYPERYPGTSSFSPNVSRRQVFTQELQSYCHPSADAFDAFCDSDIPRSVPLSFYMTARAIFKETVERSYLYTQSPVFAALGRFIENETVLQCVAYHRRPVAALHYGMLSLRNCAEDLCFEFSYHSVQGVNAHTPNWISIQQRTISHMSPKMKQVLWSVSRVLSGHAQGPEGGFFTSLHLIRELRDKGNREGQIPVYYVKPGDQDAVVLPHHHYDFVFELNQGPEVLGMYKEEFRVEMSKLLEDWVMVFLALLEHVALENQNSIINAYFQYFLSLAD
ncbi:hypothetical protein B0H14DRAFT_2730130, partial [Mycena olivaceomarginata]